MRLRVFTEPQQGATYDDQLAVALAAERLGFDAFFRSDHYLVMGDHDGLPGPTDAWITLAGLARETSTIRLGTLMTAATFRQPGPLAISVAQVDHMSRGRVEFGLGTGWYEAEHAAYGIPFPPLGERFDRLTDQLEIITGMWATPVGETYSHDGEYYRVTDSPGLPKPVQTPIPILIGGGGARRTPALAARFAAEFNIAFTSLTDSASAFDRVHRACEAVERAPESIILSAAQVVCCGTSEAELERRAAAMGRELGELRVNGLAGSPAEVVEKALEFKEIGTGRMYLQMLDMSDLDHLELIATEVMPHVA